MKVAKKILFIVLLIAIILGLGWGSSWCWTHRPWKKEETSTQLNIDSILSSRKKDLLEQGSSEDPFGDNDIVSVLLIGLDTRTGTTEGHCDAIQFIEINRATNKVKITAVPRGTYAPLPAGGNYLASDYYVSNSCGLVSLEYGVEQIERILAKKTDYIVVVGFSEALGVFRKMELPAEETLQWLRQRQGYAVGEPQRAHNHSTFIKQQLVNLLPKLDSALNVPWQFLVYRMVNTDLSFSQSRAIIVAMEKMDLSNNPGNISLAMRPAHEVQEISYDPEKIDAYLKSMIEPIKHLLDPADYSEISQADAAEKILTLYNNKKEDPEFIIWALENGLWYQIVDEEKRQEVHYEIISKYVVTLEDKKECENIIVDYIWEMDELGETFWAKKGRALLLQTLDPVIE